VRFEFLAAPVRLLGEGGAVTGVECTRMALGEPDGSGRRQVTPVPDSTFVIPTRTVVIAAGYYVDDDITRLAPSLARRRDGTVIVDPATGMTSIEGVFAAGDLVSGPDLVVTALAAGRRVGAAVHAYLSRAQDREAAAEQ